MTGVQHLGHNFKSSARQKHPRQSLSIHFCFLPNLTRVKFGSACLPLGRRYRARPPRHARPNFQPSVSPQPPLPFACALGQSDRSTCHWQVEQAVLWHPFFMGGSGKPRPPKEKPPQPRAAGANSGGPSGSHGSVYRSGQSPPSRCAFLRASLRARRIASAFSRAFLTEGFSKCCLSFISRNTPSR